MLLDELISLGGLQIFPHHFCDEFFEADAWSPTQFGFGLVGVPQERFHLRRAELARINCNNAPPLSVETLFLRS